MIRPRLFPILAAALIVCLGSLHHLALAGKKVATKAPTRILFSGNFEGELEPCG
jgi:hypothetical protein